MGSQSDWSTMRHAAETLETLGVPFEARIISAHRTPKRMMDYASSAKDRGLKVIIAGAGGAAHLPGMTAAMTPLPVLGVPVESAASRDKTVFFPLSRCRPASPSALWPLAAPGPSTPPFWQLLSSDLAAQRSWRPWKTGGPGSRWPSPRFQPTTRRPIADVGLSTSPAGSTIGILVGASWAA